MANAPGDGEIERGILDVIRSLSAQAASGRLQISTGMTDGVLFFNEGRLVDARMGRLTGFQAINALASVPDATYNFEPATHPPTQTSITAKERLLLKDFFGIEAVDVEPPRDVDLSSPDADDEATLVTTTPPVEQPRFLDIPATPLPVEPIPRSTFRPALFVVLLFLVAAAAFAIVYRLRKTDSTPPVAQTVESPSPAASPQSTAVPDTAGAPAAVAAVPDLTGNWNVVNTVEQTSYGAYKNMRIGFNVSINQNGKDFTGQGEKISENGRSLPAAGRTPIVVKGTIDGDKVEATFSETGAMRKTDGRFVWRIDKTSGGLSGTFSSNAARSSGKSAATKEL